MISEFNYWFNGTIYAHPQKQIHRETVESLIGYKYNEIKFCFSQIGVLALYSAKESNFYLELPTGVNVRGDCIICVFYYPLYQFQAMGMRTLEKAVSELRQWGTVE